MGIPHGAMGGMPNPSSNPHRSPNRSPPREKPDFPSFEDTFKPKKMPESQTFDETPVGPSNEEPAFETQSHFSQDHRKPDAFNIDFNDNKSEPPAQNAPEPEVKEAPILNDDPMEQPIVTKSQPAQDPTPVDPNVVNVDEIAIKPKQQLTFEEMLEKELKEKENQVELSKDDDRVIRKKPKKEFLKRTTKKSAPPKGSF